MNFYIFDG